MDSDFSKATKNGQEVTVRNLRTLKLWEISPVIWGMNQETTTTGTKQKEQKPWDIFIEDEQFCVYKVDEEGNATGDSMGCHPTEAEAQAQIAALHANVDEDDGKQMTEETDPEIVPDEEGPFLYECPGCGYQMEVTSPAGDVECPECGEEMRRVEQSDKDVDAEEKNPDKKAGELSDEITTVKTLQLANEFLIAKDAGVLFDSEGNLIKLPGYEPADKAGRVLAERNASRLVTALGTIIEILEDAGIEVPGFEKLPQAKPPKDETAPDKQAALETSDVKQAGPDGDPPTSDELILLDISRARIALTGLTDVED